jgi:hypothetical protein
LGFARAADELQRAVLVPIRLRIGVHTGEIQLRDEGNYAGPTINRTARQRDLGHGGQTLLSGATEGLVVDRLPTDAWLTDLGTNPLPRALRCPPRRRSRTRNAAAANANAPPAAGTHLPQPSATSCDWWPEDSATTTLPQGFSSHHARCNPTSPTSTASWA